VKLSWTVQAPTLAGAEQLLVQGRELGYSSYNVKIGPPQTPHYDAELVRMVRRFEPEGFHWADANTGYDLDTARAIAPKLAEAGFAALESPLPPARIRDYQALKRQGAVPILMDEGIVSPVETAEFIALGMMDGIAMKVARCGGLWPAAQIVRQLDETGLRLFASGLTDSEWSLAASIHLFAAAGLQHPAALNGPQYLAGRGTAAAGFRAVRDVIRLPEAPGLGVAADERAVASLRVAAES
jgi:L-alanine-DL-glutamate epimerase-like enolase superfamily enzyme